MMEDADNIIELYKLRMEAWGMDPTKFSEGAKWIRKKLEKEDIDEIIRLPLMMEENDIEDIATYLQTDGGTLKDRLEGWI